MKKLTHHKLGNQDIYSTPGIHLQLGAIKSEETEVWVEDKEVDEVFKKPKDFRVQKQKLVRKQVRSIDSEK